MFKLLVTSSDKEYEYEAGKSLLKILLDAKIFVDNPCNGKGTCGKCKVKIISGNIHASNETEKRLLSEEEIKEGIRLACLVMPETDLKIELLQKERKHKVLTKGYIPEFSFEGEIQKRLHSFGLKSGKMPEKMYGIAIDIGTTTVVCALIDMYTGKEIENVSNINAQKHFGLDVLTRITYEIEHPESGVQELQYAIVDSINEMLGELCNKANANRTDIYEIVVAANCTMLHTLLGVEAISLGRAPYEPVFKDAKQVKASEIGIQIAAEGSVYCLPSVSAYIGADIVAGAYVCELQKEKDNVLFVDIGTNGEIVLANKGRLLCCSCAAGPALEGMNISSGMRAAEGAIEDIVITENEVKLQVIGDEEPAGLCGSGILAAVKELLRVGLLKKEGAFIKPKQMEENDYRHKYLQMNGAKREFVVTREPVEILVTQSDVRQVQLAKGAILSGFIALLQKAGIQMEDLDKVMIAGQFGAHLPVDSLTGIGILPKEVKGKLVYVGNTSKTGAYMALMSTKVRNEIEQLAKVMEYTELSEMKEYERLFIECLTFPGN